MHGFGIGLCSENENKVYAMTLTRPCIRDSKHRKAWKSGRGEVAHLEKELFSLSLITFSLFNNIYKLEKLLKTVSCNILL